MYRDATNLFRLRFHITLDYDFTKAFEMFDNWFTGVQEKLRNDGVADIFHKIEVCTNINSSNNYNLVQ